MWLLDSILRRLKNAKKPQQKLLGHVIWLRLMLPGRVTFRNLSRYGPYHEKTFARWFARDFDFVTLHHATIVEAVPPSHEHVFAFDPSFISKSGKQTYGLDMFWNGAHSRAEKGLEIATLAWIDVTQNSAYALSGEQTPTAPRNATELTRIDTYVTPMAQGVTTQPLEPLPYRVVDGYCSKTKFIDGICALHWPVVGKLRRDAHLRHLYRGPRHRGPGRPQIDDGKVDVSARTRFAQGDAGDAAIALYSQVVHHPQ